MIGTGTQTEPYIVKTVQEFREVCDFQDSYIKLGNDLDCNRDKYYDWTSLNIKAKEIDFNGFSLLYPYLTKNQSLFVNNQSSQTIKNGKIVKLFGENCNTAILSHGYNPEYVNMAFVDWNINTVSDGVDIFYGLYFELCNMNLETKKGGIVFNNCIGKNSRFDVFRNIANNSMNAFINEGTYSGCLFVGSVVSKWNRINFNQYFTSELNGCVVDLDFSNTDFYGGYLRTMIKSGSTNIINIDTFNPACMEIGAAMERTTEQMLNPTYNNANGFTVIEV